MITQINDKISLYKIQENTANTNNNQNIFNTTSNDKVIS